MKKFVVALPVKNMKNALNAVDEVRKRHEKIDREIAALPALNAVEDGMNAVRQRKDTLEEFEHQKQEISKKCVAAIDAQYNACIAEIDRQTMPTGADISGENEADFRLLEYGLVNSPAALSKLAEAHDTPAFRLMIQKYAAAREWEGFSFIDKESIVRSFCDDIFEQCRKAAISPRGYYGLLLEDDKEFERQASAASLYEEYIKGLSA